MNRKTVSRVLLALVLAALATGCVDRGTSLSTGPKVETLTGFLSGKAGSAVSCAWLQDSNGRRVEVFWPDRWSVEFEPVRLLDEQGHEIAQEGDAVSVTGYYNEVGASLCALGTTFSARTVSVPSPTPG